VTTDLALPSEQQQTTIATFLHTLEPEIARAMPNGNDAARLARIALTACRKDRNLARSTAASFSGALLTAVALGLEPGTDEAYLVAYRDSRTGNYECQLIVGYHGLSKLYYQHPLAGDIDAQYVCARDEFDWRKGTDPYLRHRPADGDRGEVVAYYAVARLTNGVTRFEVLTPGQCKALRGGKVGPDPRFKGGDPEHWMERKTVLKQLAKLLPKSATFTAALNADERSGTELRVVRPPLPGEMPDPPPPLAVGDHVNRQTGEVTTDAEIVEDPPTHVAAADDHGHGEAESGNELPTPRESAPASPERPEGEAPASTSPSGPSTDDEPTWRNRSDSASKAQVKVIQTLAGKLGMDDQTKHRYAERLVGHTLAGEDGHSSFNNLTVREASLVVDALNDDYAQRSIQ
jgi:recombination protein RecT